MRWQQIHIPGVPGYPLRRLKTDRFWYGQLAVCSSTAVPSDTMLFVASGLEAALARKQAAKGSREEAMIFAAYASGCLKVTGLKP